MSETNHTDNKLRQLENQSLPDLSRQDQHWQDMKKMLQPGTGSSQTAAGTTNKLWQWVLAACFIGGIALLIFNQQGKKSVAPGGTITSKTGNNEPKTPVVQNEDSLPRVAINEEKTAGDPATSKNNKNFNPRSRIKKDKKQNNLVIKTYPPDIIQSPLQPAKPGATLADFFKQLEKAEQAFTINPRKDTIINGAGGTALMVPANTFSANKQVTILLKEYYDYEDIITNKLCTQSDGRQLITGGMIHIMAIAEGKEINMNPDKAIRWFVPDTSIVMRDMRIFEGQTRAGGPRADFDGAIGMDTVSADTSTLETINWVPGKEVFTTNYLVTKVKALDLSNEPFKTKEKKNGLVGKFRIDDNSKLSREELESMLREKYNYYKVKVKTRRHYRTIHKGNNSNFEIYYNSLGDSAWFSPDNAKKYNLTVTDTITYMQTRVVYAEGNYVKRSFQNVNLNALSDRFSVDIRTLGWINCDKFYNDKREKLNYYIDLGDSAYKYYTVLVFDKVKSMVKGNNMGKQVFFGGVPKGETARIICIGIQDGKTVAAMHPLSASATVIRNLKFEETNPSAFREQAATMDEKP